jgi:hypothetical protein
MDGQRRACPITQAGPSLCLVADAYGHAFQGRIPGDAGGSFPTAKDKPWKLISRHAFADERRAREIRVLPEVWVGTCILPKAPAVIFGKRSTATHWHEMKEWPTLATVHR